jgi:hypothetical protein
VFNREQTDVDTLPTGGAPNVIEGIDSASTRLLWEDDGTTYYAAKGSGSNSGYTCLVMFTGTEGTSACSTGAVTIELRGSPAYMLADAPSESDKWLKVAEHLYVEK